MRKTVSLLTLFSVLLLVFTAMAANQVVVIPLKGTPTGPPAPTRKTGQTAEYTPYDDGTYNKGVEDASPRWIYTQPRTGEITLYKAGYGYRDNNTGLIWYPDASHAETTFSGAVSHCEDLRTVAIFQAYLVEDWRLPNIVELQSLINYGQAQPPLPVDHHFTNVQPVFYWSSTSYFPAPTIYAWGVDLLFGESYHDLQKNNSASTYVLCVRD